MREGEARGGKSGSRKGRKRGDNLEWEGERGKKKMMWEGKGA
jgi:hypothetical protein